MGGVRGGRLQRLRSSRDRCASGAEHAHGHLAPTSCRPAGAGSGSAGSAKPLGAAALDRELVRLVRVLRPATWRGPRRPRVAGVDAGRRGWNLPRPRLTRFAASAWRAVKPRRRRFRDVCSSSACSRARSSSSASSGDLNIFGSSAAGGASSSRGGSAVEHGPAVMSASSRHCTQLVRRVPPTADGPQQNEGRPQAPPEAEYG